MFNYRLLARKATNQKIVEASRETIVIGDIKLDGIQLLRNMEKHGIYRWRKMIVGFTLSISFMKSFKKCWFLYSRQQIK